MPAATIGEVKMLRRWSWARACELSRSGAERGMAIPLGFKLGRPGRKNDEGSVRVTGRATGLSR